MYLPCSLAPGRKLRIVLIGYSGVGKSSLMKNILNIDPTKIDIAHNRAWEANIEDEYESPENPRLILHDSKDFGADSKVSWEGFLRGRDAKEFPEKVHLIWFCVETPRPGIRLLEKGDEKLLALAKELNIPIIAVFTKYDILIMHFKVHEEMYEKTPDSLALEFFEKSAKELAKQSQSQITCVRSIAKGSGAQETIRNLKKVTHEKLGEPDLWFTSQQVNGYAEVIITISEGFKKYWLDLARSNAFEGHTLIGCVRRIHDDVLKGWNFNDPEKILSRTDFFTQMITFVKPLIDAQVNLSQHQADILGFGATDAARPLGPLLNEFHFSPSAINYLYSKYQPLPSTAKFLATYLVNLILVMNRVLAHTPFFGSLEALSDDLVFKVLRDHRADLEKNPVEKIKWVPEAATRMDP